MTTKIDLVYREMNAIQHEASVLATQWQHHMKQKPPPAHFGAEMAKIAARVRQCAIELATAGTFPIPGVRAEQPAKPEIDPAMASLYASFTTEQREMIRKLSASEASSAPSGLLPDLGGGFPPVPPEPSNGSSPV